MKLQESLSLNNLGWLLLKEGNVPAAQRMNQEALTLSKELGDKPYTTIHGLLGLGSAQAAAGDLAGARKNWEQALAMSKQTGNKSTSADAFYGLGQLFHLQGNLRESRINQEEALSLRSEAGLNLTADSRLELAKLLIDEGRLPEAENLARQAVEESYTKAGIDVQAEAENVLANVLLKRRCSRFRPIGEQ